MISTGKDGFLIVWKPQEPVNTNLTETSAIPWDLPKDLLRIIFSQLDFVVLTACANVCTTWRNLIQEDKLLDSWVLSTSSIDESYRYSTPPMKIFPVPCRNWYPFC